MEDELLAELSRMAVTRLLTKLKENGELGDFVRFAKERAKENGMDSDDFMNFLDDIGKLAEEDETEEEDDVTVYCIKVGVKKL